MEEWYALKRGYALEDKTILHMTAEERKWWIDKIQKEQDELRKQHQK